MNSIEQLTALQEELGYKQGELSTVAMLGLVGEAGEVLKETRFKHDGDAREGIVWKKEQTILFTEKLEIVKKDVRKGTSKVCIVVQDSELKDFKAELADTFYYINILATNVGLTVSDLAQMAHDKIRCKQAEGGSSEDRKS